MSDIFDAGFSPELARTESMLQPSLGSYQGALPNVVEGEMAIQGLSSGAVTQLMYSKKDTFSSTTAGYRMGVDPATDTYKWIIGDSSNSVDWNVTSANTLTIVGSISASTIDGATITGSDITGATITFQYAQTTAALSGNRIRINGTGTGSSPTQTAHSIGIIEGGTNIMEIKGGAGSVDDPIINFTPAADSGQTGFKGSTATTATTGGMVDLYATHASGGVTLLRMTNSGTGSNSFCMKATNASTTNAPIISIGALVSTNFRRVLKGNNATIWESNGTTPNGNLSGTAGDICLNGDSGNIYRCTGTTTWVAM